MSRTRSAAPAPPRLRRAIPLLISLLAALSLTSGCASLAPSPPRSGADGLRAAAEETKKRPEERVKRIAEVVRLLAAGRKQW